MGAYAKFELRCLAGEVNNRLLLHFQENVGVKATVTTAYSYRTSVERRSPKVTALKWLHYKLDSSQNQWQLISVAWSRLSPRWWHYHNRPVLMIHPNRPEQERGEKGGINKMHILNILLHKSSYCCLFMRNALEFKLSTWQNKDFWTTSINLQPIIK